MTKHPDSRIRRRFAWPIRLALAFVAVTRTQVALADAPKANESQSTAPAPPAATRPVVVWPTLTPAGDSASKVELHRPAELERGTFTRAHELDATLRDAVQDLGYTLYVAESGPDPGRTRDLDLIERAARSANGSPSEEGTWVVSPRIELAGKDEFVLRIVVVPPKGRELRVRVETVMADDLPVRAIVMLRDLLLPGSEEIARNENQRNRPDSTASAGIMGPLRSQGRAVLAVNAALFGGYIAYSLQRASGSDDPRVLYPLLAVGTGVGIGSALLVSEEWDVTTGDAWYLSAGAWWGAGSGILIANAERVSPLSDRFAWGVAGGLAGLGLATFSLTRHRMDEGDATLAHSGAALGLFWGGLGELAYRGTTDATPHAGMGYGAAVGLVLAGAMATQVNASPSRVLLVDVGVGLGSLAGAAVGSPLIFEDVTENKTRAWLGCALGGSLAGGAVAWWVTRDSWSTKRTWLPKGLPMAGVIGSSPTPRGNEPAYGIGWRGAF